MSIFSAYHSVSCISPQTEQVLGIPELVSSNSVITDLGLADGRSYVIARSEHFGEHTIGSVFADS